MIAAPDSLSALARVARGIVARTVWDSDCEDAVRNLDEIYEARLAARGRLSADLWYWGQAFTFGPRLWLDLRGRRPVVDERDRSYLAVWAGDVLADVRFAMRGFQRTPGFTLAAVATLSLGIAATALAYTVVRGVVLRPLPFPEPDQLVWVWPSGNFPLSHETFLELQTRVADAGELTAFASRAYALQGGTRPAEVLGVAVSTNHFDVVGRGPALGRVFFPEDGVAGNEPVALISHEIWQSHFGGDSAVVGRQVDLFMSAAIPMIPGAFTGTAHTVVGVLPPAYEPFGFPLDVVTPLVRDTDDASFGQLSELGVVGRLAPGRTPEQLRTALVTAAGQMPGLRNSAEQIAAEQVMGLHRALTGSVRSTLYITFAAVAFVLLMACANVANLMFARTQGRGAELDVRNALGASRGRIVRQLLTECAVLAVVAGVVGTGVMVLALPAFVRMLPPQLGVSASSIRFDPTVVAFVAVCLAVTLVVTGLVPAFQGVGRLTGRVLGRRGIGGPRRRHTINHALVAGELALALMLATGAGLLLKSFNRLSGVELGFSPEDVVTIRIAPAHQQYRSTELRRALFTQTLAEVRAVPGVVAAGAIHFLPIAEGGPGVNFLLDPADPESRQSTGYRVVTPGYLETMQIPVIEGRSLLATDAEGGALVGLVNQTLAQRLWPDESAVGRRLYRTSGQEWFTVVGVTGDVRQAALGLPPNPEAYLPLAQSSWSSAMSVVVRAPAAGAGILTRIEDIVWSLDPDVPITRSATMDELVAASVAAPRFYSVVFSLFGLAALGLGAIGLYGVVSSVVRQRTDEIGVRIALGATTWAILKREMARAFRVVTAGIFVGLLGTVAASRALRSLLFEVSPFDPLVFMGTATVLGTVAALSAFIPAHRASRVDPVVTIRDGH